MLSENHGSLNRFLWPCKDGRSLNSSLNDVSVKQGLGAQIEFDLEGITLGRLLSTLSGSGATELPVEISHSKIHGEHILREN